jgi:hypothetical protein
MAAKQRMSCSVPILVAPNWLLQGEGSPKLRAREMRGGDWDCDILGRVGDA